MDTPTHFDITQRVFRARVEAWRRSGAYRNDQSPSQLPKPHLRLHCAVLADGGLGWAIVLPGRFRTPVMGQWYAHCGMAIEKATHLMGGNYGQSHAWADAFAGTARYRKD